MQNQPYVKMNCFDSCHAADILYILTDYSKVLCAFQPGSHLRQGLTQMQNQP